MIDQLKPLIGKLTIFAKKRMGFQHPPKLFLRDDSDNSKKMLGKTAHYDPQAKAVTLFTHNRHPKDILRSYAHELVHHTQNLRGDLSSEKCGEMGQGYAQDNGHMRNMEKEAYLEGNMCFRDWEDTLNDKDNYIIMKIAESKILKENKTMTKKITKEFLKETIRKIIAEQAPAMSAPAATGDEALAAHKAVIAQYKKGNPGVSKKDYQRAVAAVSAAGEEKPKDRPTIPDFEKSYKGYQAFAQSALEEEVEELEEADAFAPSHYCVHHGGVQHEGKIVAAEAVQHNYNEKLGKVTHYDMKLPDGTILENIATEDIQVTNATLAEGHGGHKMKKDDDELEEGGNAKTDKHDDDPKLKGGQKNLPDSLQKGIISSADSDSDSEEKKDESKIQTPEQETSLYESRFAGRNNRLFENLTKKWTK
jgi:hypothetical protein